VLVAVQSLIGRDGLMRVGPMSTGADPGPACYGKGGREATVSDANLVLGRLPEELIGGGMRLDPRLAEEAIAPLAAKLDLSLRETALGIVRIVNANMMLAIRVVSIERGRDPRVFTLIPFGGAGALHAVEIARELGIRVILVPAAPGILCAEELRPPSWRRASLPPAACPSTAILHPSRPSLLRAARRSRAMVCPREPYRLGEPPGYRHRHAPSARTSSWRSLCHTARGFRPRFG
jgi:hypothetical protein